MPVAEDAGQHQHGGSAAAGIWTRISKLLADFQAAESYLCTVQAVCAQKGLASIA